MSTEKEKSLSNATVAWLTSSATFVSMVIYGVFISDIVRDANGNRLPVLPVFIFTLVAVILLKKVFHDLYKK